MMHSGDDIPLVLVVDDEVLMRFQLKRALEQEGYRVAEATNGRQCLELYPQIKPDLILLDALMPVMDGFTCCARLQEMAAEEQIAPVLITTGLDDVKSIDLAFEVGATDYVQKPIHWAVLRQRVRRLIQQFRLQQQQTSLYQQLAEANRVLQHLASIDSLTQIANRRQFDQYLEHEWQRLLREQHSLSLILCDIDHFKSYNDTYGHQAGDRCLQQVAEAMQATVKRPADLVARYGGEEFAVILPNTEVVGAVRVAEAIRAAVKALQIQHINSSVLPYISLSLGVACMTPQSTLSFDQLIAAADRALYQAKAAGRDRVVWQKGQESLLLANCRGDVHASEPEGGIDACQQSSNDGDE